MSGWGVTYVFCQGRYTLFESINLLVDFFQVKVRRIEVLMALNTYLFKFCPGWLSCWLYYKVLWLIRSERYSFGSRIKEIIFITFIDRRQTTYGSNSWNIKKLFISKQSFICWGSFIHFIVVAVFINCSSSWQHHKRGLTCYNFWENLISNKIVLTLTLVLTNIKK